MENNDRKTHVSGIKLKKWLGYHIGKAQKECDRETEQILSAVGEALLLGEFDEEDVK